MDILIKSMSKVATLANKLNYQNNNSVPIDDATINQRLADDIKAASSLPLPKFELNQVLLIINMRHGKSSYQC